MRIGYLDCFSGVAGDMWVGAMLDAGLELGPLEDAVASLGLSGVSISSSTVPRASLVGTHFVVSAPEIDAHRHLSDILRILEKGQLPDAVRDRAEATFRALAEVEAAAHGCDIESVHFHEVGAADAIVDVVCVCLGVHLLGLERIYSSAVTTGTGTVVCDHGTMPVPAPGALGNLYGIPIRTGGPGGERTTPTGAALLRSLVDEFEPQLVWVPERSGYGAGTKDDPDHPNLLRLTIGETRDPGTALALWELSCHVDTATGEQLGHLLEATLRAGATDAFATPIHMKKGRPGFLVTALADAAHRTEVANLLLEESTSLGVRMHAVERSALERWEETVETEFGPVRYKCARLPSGRLVQRPEADEVARLAGERGVGAAEIRSRLP